LSASQVISLVESSTRLLVFALADLPSGFRIFHPAGLADGEGYVAMACDELLVHGSEIAGAMDAPFQPPDQIAGRVARRLFPWAPNGFGDWETLQWANDRSDLGGQPPPGPTWVWHSRPLAEWDRSIPQWDPVARQVVERQC
jgi:hypothetical protein